MPTRLELKEGFVENLGKERLRLGYTQKQMADALDMNVESYKKLESGKIDKIDFYIAVKMHELTGKFGYEQAGFPIENGDVHSIFKQLSPYQKKYIESIVRFEYDFSIHNPQYEQDYVTCFVPMGSMRDGMIYDSANVFKLNIAAYRKRFGEKITCALKITSNDLLPVYHLDDILLISQEPPRHGDIGIFMNRQTHRVYVRKFYQTDPVRLEPITDFGNDIVIDIRNKEHLSSWIKFGHVITKIR